MKSAFLPSKGLLCLYDKQNNTRLLVDMEFLFSCSTRHLTRSLRSLVSYRVKHSKRNSISTRAHILFSIYLDRSSNTVQGSWFTAVLPYIESVSEVLGRCLQQPGVRTVFKSDKTVGSHFDHSANKDPIMSAKKDGAV